MKLKLARDVVVDFQHREIWIDGQPFPWYVADSLSIEVVPEFPIVVVNLPVYADNVHVLNTIEDDLQEIRDIGAREMASAKRWFDRHCVEAELAKVRRRIAELRAQIEVDL